MDGEPPALFDRRQHRRRLDRAASRFADADFLKRRAAEDAVDRLSAVTRLFPKALDLGARLGAFSQALSAAQNDQVGLLIQADLSGVMIAAAAGRPGLRLAADEERLPFADGAFDLVTALLSLHWTNDLVGALVQIRRVLRPDGLFIGALLGGRTLMELRGALIEAEAEISGGAGPRVSPFADAFDGAALLQRAGFALPVADIDRLTVRYDTPFKLLADLRAMGETNALVDRPRRGLSRRVLQRMSEIYFERHASPDGRIPATFEIVSLTGWAPHESQQQPLKPGSARMRLADALGVVETPLDPS
jgi:SAM-dependent methyltransferase